MVKAKVNMLEFPSQYLKSGLLYFIQTVMTNSHADNSKVHLHVCGIFSTSVDLSESYSTPARYD